MVKDDFSENIYWQLMGTLMAAKRLLAPILDRNGVTGVQAYILISLSSEDGKPMSLLAEHLRCDASNITTLVDKLELLGLIERRADPADRRIKLLFLTAKCRQTYRKLIDDIRTLESQSLTKAQFDKKTVEDALAIIRRFI